MAKLMGILARTKEKAVKNVMLGMEGFQKFQMENNNMTWLAY
jgi:hypothetical protein